MIFARMAATQVGATTMDRPEWVAVHPDNKSVFCTLTNNKYRGVRENQPINAVNPREKNPYGISFVGIQQVVTTHQTLSNGISLLSQVTLKCMNLV
ncbi:putative phosphatase [Vibrio variabilis]|uniref:Phosphatase n=1 Tax=Vibrio variabilis TaxID=990271 RepID=A0ABQ0JKX1_9VIBR|nr:putative phosphatase [Vibrio variabilis]